MEFALESLGWKSFQDLALMYVQQQFGVAAVSFSAGPDGGRDGAALITRNAHPSLGQVAVQAKHSGQRRRFRLSDLTPELKKIEALVSNGHCDTYLLITNSDLSATVEGNCRKKIETAGANKAVVVGRDEIVRRLTNDKTLRGLIPRVYGLGDLSELLDERLYAQTLALIDQNEMDRFVATEPYLQTLLALESYRFSLILGEPASGKSSIMRAAAIHAADRWGLAPMWLDSITELALHWNVHRSDQLFLLDDVFGTTNHDPQRTDEWNRAIPRVREAIRHGSQFLLTSRDYVYRAAKPSLKSHELPVDDGQVVIRLSRMLLPDRRQIVYNHLRLGRQSREFRAAAKPHLAQLTTSQRFLPETARRLGDPRFTAGLDPSSRRDLAQFVEEPREYLLTLIEGLEERLQVVLLLLMANGGSIESPLPTSDLVTSTLVRFGLTKRQIAQGLEELDGSLVRLVSGGGDRNWQVRHPTVIDSMGDWLLTHPELIDLFCMHASASELRRQTTCGFELQGAVSLPRSVWPVVFDRMLASEADTDSAFRYFASRCSWAALRSTARLDDVALLLDRRPFASPLDSDPKVRLFLRLCDRESLSPGGLRTLLEEAVDVATQAFDPYVLTNVGFEEIAAQHQDGDYWPSVIEQFITRITDGLEDEVASRIGRYDSTVDRLDTVADVAALLDYLEEWTSDDAVLRLIGVQRRRIRDWAGDNTQATSPTESMKRLADAVFGFRSEAEDLFSDVDE